MPKNVLDEILPVPKIGEELVNSNGNAFCLEAHRAENGNIYILMFLPHTTRDHFATGLYIGSGQWLYGHYFDNVNEALSDYMER